MDIQLNWTSIMKMVACFHPEFCTRFSWKFWLLFLRWMANLVFSFLTYFFSPYLHPVVPSHLVSTFFITPLFCSHLHLLVILILGVFVFGRCSNAMCSVYTPPKSPWMLLHITTLSLPITTPLLYCSHRGNQCKFFNFPVFLAFSCRSVCILNVLALF